MIEIAVGIGVTFSLIFHEVFGLAAGGIVVPGYIALNFHRPWMIIGTLLVALVTWLGIKVVSQFVFVYGRRRMVLAVLLGFILGYYSRVVWSHGIGDIRLEAIGYIIPGLIANWMERQGVFKTITTVLMAGAAVRLIAILVMGGRLIGNV